MNRLTITQRIKSLKTYYKNDNGGRQFFEQNFFSYEAHFTIAGYVNKQNCRIWGFENSQVIEDRTLYPEMDIEFGPKVWLDLTGRLSLSYDNRFFLPPIEEYDLENVWFQQNGATCYTTRANIALLQEKFPGRLISNRGNINWPPRSCDLTPLDFFCGATQKLMLM